MTKEEVELNIKLLPYHKKYLKAMARIVEIRRDKSIARVDQRAMIRDIRTQLMVEWKEINERISNNN
jgi:hypothetical protein